MGFYVSPGVYVKEKDISDIIPNISTTTAALVGYAVKGDIDNPVLVTNTQQFIEEFGEPSVVNGYFHYSALAFLENGNQLYCQRVVKSALYGGAKIMQTGDTNIALSVGLSTKTFQEFSLEDIAFEVYGKNPGVWNNAIGVRIVNLDAVTYEFDIEVYAQDADGNWDRVEQFTVSRKTKVDGFGKQMYLESAINGYSSYIWVADSLMADTVMPEAQASTLVLAGGSNGNAITSAEVVIGWNKFANPDDIDIRMMINGGYTDVVVQQAMKTIAEDRKDCVAILDVPSSVLTSVTAITAWRTDTQNFNSSYCALYAPWLKIYDSYNDQVIEVPPSGYVCSMIAYNDYVGEPWFAAAGFNRGLLNVLGMTNVFTQGERDTLYPAQVNPLQTFRGEGNVIWGQKTQQTKASALDRLNVRRLLIIIQKSISASLRYFAFEPNSEITRFRITAAVEEYMALLSSRGAFQTEIGDRGYRVICDSTNNTPAIIDRNELHVDIFIKPSRSAEYVQLQTIITSTGASFEELIARGVQF